MPEGRRGTVTVFDSHAFMKSSSVFLFPGRQRGFECSGLVKTGVSTLYNGNLVRMTDRKGFVTNYSYDKCDRLARVDYGDGSYLENTYDAVRRLIRIYDSISGPIEYEYPITGCTTGCSGGAIDRVIRETTPALGSIS